MCWAICYSFLMFIKEIEKKNKGYEKSFKYHRLMESYRTPRGPRQRTILNLGTLDLPKNQWKSLADLIEAKVLGKKSLFEADKHIDELASHYANLIIHRHISLGDINEDNDESLLKNCYITNNPYYNRVKEWIDIYNDNFNDPSLMRELCVERSSFLLDCNEEKCLIIKKSTERLGQTSNFLEKLLRVLQRIKIHQIFTPIFNVTMLFVR